MAKVRTDDAALVDAAAEWRRRDPLARFGDDVFAAVETTEAAAPMFVARLKGDAPGELTVFVGAEAAPRLLERFVGGGGDGTGAEAGGVEDLDALRLRFVAAKDAPSEAIGLLKLVGKAGEFGDVAPWFSARRAGKRPRALNKDERVEFLRVLKALLVSDADGKLEATPLTEGGAVQLLSIEGEPNEPLIEYATIDPKAPSGFRTTGACAAPEDVDTAAIPRVGGVFGVHVRPAEGGGEGVELFVVDFKSETLVDRATYRHDDPAGLSDEVWRALDGRGVSGFAGLPDVIRFTSPTLLRAMTSALAKVGVAAEGATRLPPLQRAIDEDDDALAEAEEDRRIGDEMKEAPADDDFDGWRRVEFAVAKRVRDLVDERGLLTVPLAAAFFGDRRFADLAVGNPEEYAAELDALSEWIFARNRDPKTGKTPLQEALETTPSAAHAAVYAARRDARASLYRVEGVGEDGVLSARDLATDGGVLITADVIAEEAEAGDLFAATVLKLGAFAFLRGATAIFPKDREKVVLAKLTKAGAGAKLENLADRPDLVGRLFVDDGA
jgi:hypothetical protein